MRYTVLRMPAQTYLIGIAGPSGAGKSYLACNLARELNAFVLGTDAYYRGLGHLPLHARARWNFDDPAAVDHGLLIQHVSLLGRGKQAEIPQYDFTSHTRGKDTRLLTPSGVVIVEGLFTLYWPELRELFGTKVYVDLHDGLCFQRRSARDVRERGRTAQSVWRQYTTTVAPMAERFVRPTLTYADVVVSGDGLIETGVRLILEHYRKHAVRELHQADSSTHG